MPWRRSVSLHITSCTECPFHRTARTPGSGSAIDYFCTKQMVLGGFNLNWRAETYNPHGYEIIAGYVETSSEEPQPGKIPAWCPLAKKRR